MKLTPALKINKEEAEEFLKKEFNIKFNWWWYAWKWKMIRS
jgi:hypothetical protein